MRLSSTEAQTTPSAGNSGKVNPKPKWITSSVIAWPATATQRIRTKRRRLIRSKSPRGSGGLITVAARKAGSSSGGSGDSGRLLDHAPYRGDVRARHRRIPPGQALWRHPGRQRRVVHDRAWRHRGAAGRQRRRQDDDAGDPARSAVAEFGRGADLRRGRVAAPLPGIAANQLLLALCRPAAPADRAAESGGLRATLRRAAADADDRAAGRRFSDRSPARPASRQIVGRAEDARRAGQGAVERSGTAAARRADRLARPRYRRLGTQLSRSLSRPHRRDDPVGLAQHGRGRADVLRRDHAEGRPGGRSRRAGGADRPLRAHRPGRSVSTDRSVAAERAGAGVVTGAFDAKRAMRRFGEAAFEPARVWAMLLRYLYILRSSWPRTLELLYWPTLQMLIWGFMSQFLRTNSSYVAKAFGVLLGAVILWDALFRSQLGLSISFLEEMWARNLGQLFVTPLRPYEWVISLLAMSLIRVTIGIAPATLLAIPLYDYSIFAMGLP